jgi:DNA-binding transcriptional ArsR family regulator
MRIRKKSDQLPEDDVLLISKASDALAHPARVRIFRYIYNANMSRELVCNKNVVAAFEYSQATISQHIKKLVQSELVHVERKDNFSYYYVNIGMLGKYLNAVKTFQ